MHLEVIILESKPVTVSWVQLVVLLQVVSWKTSSRIVGSMVITIMEVKVVLVGVVLVVESGKPSSKASIYGARKHP